MRPSPHFPVPSLGKDATSTSHRSLAVVRSLTELPGKAVLTPTRSASPRFPRFIASVAPYSICSHPCRPSLGLGWPGSSGGVGRVGLGITIDPCVFSYHHFCAQVCACFYTRLIKKRIQNRRDLGRRIWSLEGW